MILTVYLMASLSPSPVLSVFALFPYFMVPGTETSSRESASQPSVTSWPGHVFEPSPCIQQQYLLNKPKGLPIIRNWQYFYRNSGHGCSVQTNKQCVCVCVSQWRHKPLGCNRPILTVGFQGNKPQIRKSSAYGRFALS